MTATQTLILCADDFGQSPATSAGILRLLEAGRLSATGCMTQSPSWTSDGRQLCAWRGRADLGLHFNLTHPFPGQAVPARPLASVLFKAMLRSLDEAPIALALKAQLDRFEEVMDMPPDFVDGHQHVHVFPIVRNVLLRELADRYPRHKPYLRSVAPKLRLGRGCGKEAFLRRLGSGFAKKAQAAGFRTNRSFAGIYDLKPIPGAFAAHMDRWMAEAQNGDLVMCHPGFAAQDATDPIAGTRPLELSFLASDDFTDMLARHGVSVGRMTAPR